MKLPGLPAARMIICSKPFDIEVFLLRVKKLCRAENILKYRELLLNPATMEVSKNGQRLTLTKTEFELLHCFLGNLKTVLSREWLLNSCMGDGFRRGQPYRRHQYPPPAEKNRRGLYPDARRDGLCNGGRKCIKTGNAFTGCP